MDIHQNARLTPYSREQLAKSVLFQGRTLNSAAAEFKVSGKTARKWVRRYQTENRAGLADRSSRPHRLWRPTSPAVVAQVEHLRRQRFTGIHIAQRTGLSRATVSRILCRLGIARLRDLEPAPPTTRYEHAAPGDLLHLDIKQLGRFRAVAFRPDGRRRGVSPGAGWAHVHVAIHILPDQTARQRLRLPLACLCRGLSATAAAPLLPDVVKFRFDFRGKTVRHQRGAFRSA